jgi:hypothetical protein
MPGMTKQASHWMAVVLAVAFGLPASAQKASDLPGPGTETIYSIAHVRPGMENQYAELSAKAWAIYRRLNLVLKKPHIAIRGVDSDGLPYFVEVFTWRSPEIPDHAPPEVRAVWQQLEGVCEKRNGRPGIDFTEVTAVQIQ